MAKPAGGTRCVRSESCGGTIRLLKHMLAALETVPPSPPRLRLTRADCAVLETNGLLDQQRVELIEGDLIQRMPKNWPHVHIIMVLYRWMSQVFGFEYVLQEAPINVAPEDNPTNEPQPDLIVMNRRSELKSAKPNPADLRLIVEVSDSTLGFDTTVKAALYARAGIAEYWVFDVNGRRLGVHREPRHGTFQSIVWYRGAESVAPLAAPDARFEAGSPFGQ